MPTDRGCVGSVVGRSTPPFSCHFICSLAQVAAVSPCLQECVYGPGGHPLHSGATPLRGAASLDDKGVSPRCTHHLVTRLWTCAGPADPPHCPPTSRLVSRWAPSSRARCFKPGLIWEIIQKSSHMEDRSRAPHAILGPPGQTTKTYSKRGPS